MLIDDATNSNAAASLAAHAADFTCVASPIGGKMGNPSADVSMITLDRYLRTASPRIEPKLSATLGQVALAVKRISNELTVAALRGELGLSGAINVQGEKVEKLDT